MKVKALVGEKSVLNAGTVVSPSDEKILLQVDTESGLEFTVEFEFLHEKGSSKIEMVILNENAIKIVSHGEPTSLGSGASELLEIGTVNGKKMWLYYVAYKLYEGQFLKLEYAFYEG